MRVYDYSNYQSVLDPLRERMIERPDEISFHFWTENDEKLDLTVRDLWQGSLAYAQALHDRGIRQGDLVIVVLNHSTELLYALFGSLYIGAMPSIFPYFSATHDPETYRQQVYTLVGQAAAKAVVTSPQFEAPLAELLAGSGCAVLGIEAVDLATARFSAEEVDLPIANATGGEETAIIQYTSGTTGLKKGVMLSHRAILHVVYEMIHHTQGSENDVVLNWLPLYHDYGLICGLFCPIYSGAPGVLISPYKWVRRPALLLEAIDQYGGTMCWMPNFAMNHTVRSVRKRQLEGKSLASMRALMSGAEPIRHASQQAMVDRFGDYGFSETALCAGYGMAENTLAVTITPPNVRNRVDFIDMKRLYTEERAISVDPSLPEAAPFVSCGFPFGGAEIEIRTESGDLLPDRQVGDIWLKTKSLFSGYYMRPDLTAEVLVDGWYWTGDVGYMAENELFVCSRKKDIIIVSGKNVYPKDIEAIARRLPEVKDDGIVAFGVDNNRTGSEGIVVVMEMQRKVDEDAQKAIGLRLRKLVTEEMGISLADARVVPKGWVAKTQNAKISRASNKEKYLGEFGRK